MALNNDRSAHPFLPVETLLPSGPFQILLALAVLFFFNGCTPEPVPPLRVGTNIWPGYEPLYLARDLGYFKNDPIRLVEYSSATQVINAYRNGAIEAAALTLDEVLLLVQHRLDPRLILVMDVSNGGDVILGKPGVMDLRDIRGRRVGVESTALGAYVLARALQIAGLTQDDVRIVPLQVDEHERAFREGRIEAVVTFEPVRTRLLSSGARPLFSSAQIPGEIMDVLVVRRDYLEARLRLVEALLQGWFQAVDYLKREPRDAAQRIIGRLRISPEETLASYQGLRLPDLKENHEFIAGRPPKVLDAAQRLSDFMVRRGLLTRAVDVAPIPDPRPLQAIRP